MSLFNAHPPSLYYSQITPLRQIFSPRIIPHFLSVISNKPRDSLIPHNAFSSSSSSYFPKISLSKLQSRNPKTRISNREAPIWGGEVENNDVSREFEDLAIDGVVYKKTLRLVECSMFAAVSGLAYFLSNSLAIENYFGCFFSLPIVISSLRWGLPGGRKTMVATAMLLLSLSGPVKATTYLLMHGLVGLAMGSLWRLGANWGVSIALCTFVRAMGLVGYVLLSSFLIRENILVLITINIHASLTYLLTTIGVNTIPSMNSIYAIFGTLLLLNCGFFVFVLHILYAVFFTKLGQKSSLRLPRWLEKAL